MNSKELLTTGEAMLYILKEFRNKGWLNECDKIYNSVKTKTMTELLARILVSSYRYNDISENDLQSFVLALSLYWWKEWKKIYSIDETLSKELIKDSDSEFINSDIISHLPFRGMFVRTSEMKTDNDIIGFFINVDELDGNYMFCINCLEKGDNISEIEALNTIAKTIHKHRPVNISAYYFKLEKGIIYNKQEFINEIGNLIHNNYKTINQDDIIDNLFKILIIVQYICSCKADIRQSKKTKEIFKAPGNNCKMSEIEELEVGAVIGEAIRQHPKTIVTERTDTVYIGSGKYKRPHLRRAHWQHFWVGHGDSKQLVIRWIHPIMVNGFNPDKDITIVTPVLK